MLNNCIDGKTGHNHVYRACDSVCLMLPIWAQKPSNVPCFLSPSPHSWLLLAFLVTWMSSCLSSLMGFSSHQTSFVSKDTQSSLVAWLTIIMKQTIQKFSDLTQPSSYYIPLDKIQLSDLSFPWAFGVGKYIGLDDNHWIDYSECRKVPISGNLVGMARNWSSWTVNWV